MLGKLSVVMILCDIAYCMKEENSMSLCLYETLLVYEGGNYMLLDYI
jgi:hypothetical protein